MQELEQGRLLQGEQGKAGERIDARFTEGRARLCLLCRVIACPELPPSVNYLHPLTARGAMQDLAKNFVCFCFHFCQLSRGTKEPD